MVFDDILLLVQQLLRKWEELTWFKATYTMCSHFFPIKLNIFLFYNLIEAKFDSVSYCMYPTVPSKLWLYSVKSYLIVLQWFHGHYHSLPLKIAHWCWYHCSTLKNIRSNSLYIKWGLKLLKTLEDLLNFMDHLVFFWMIFYWGILFWGFAGWVFFPVNLKIQDFTQNLYQYLYPFLPFQWN